MSLRVANLLSCGLFLCLIVGINLPPCLSSTSNVLCPALTGSRASLGPVSLGGEIIAGSLLMYSQFNLTIDGVIELQPVTGPEELASLISSQQLPANGVNASLHVTMADGQKCLCSISGGGVLNCSDFAMPKPPWPAHTGCQWHWAKGGMLMETNASRLSHTCLDSVTTSVNRPDLFWPNNASLKHNQSADMIMLAEFLITQKFNGRCWSQPVMDARIGNKGPVRISHVHQELVTWPDGNQTHAVIYRKNFGWTQHCLHECRVVFKPGSRIDTLGPETCNDLKNPFDDPAMAAELRDGCVWAFTVNCKPALVRTDNPALPCHRTIRPQTTTPASSHVSPSQSVVTMIPKQLTTIPVKDSTDQHLSTTRASGFPTPEPHEDGTEAHRHFIIEAEAAVGMAPMTAPVIELEITALCLAAANRLASFLL